MRGFLADTHLACFQLQDKTRDLSKPVPGFTVNCAYAATARPWYQQAKAKKAAGWSTVYTFAGSFFLRLF